jgi:hypothetical protein
MSNTAQYQCSCGWSTNNPVAWEHHTRYCKGRVNWNSGKLVAAVAGVLLAASLFLSPAAKAQEPHQLTALAAPVKALNLVYLPLIQFPAEVHGCDDCQAVSWRPTGS